MPKSPAATWTHGRSWFAVGWILLFLAVFFSQRLPNNGRILRWDLWPEIPFVLMDAIDPPREAGSPPRGLAYLPQRLPLLAVASLIIAGNWGWGALVLAGIERLFGPISLTRGERGYFALLIGYGATSLFTLGFGLAGWLSQGLFVATSGVGVLIGIRCVWRSGSVAIENADDPRGLAPEHWWQRHGWWLAATPFVIGMLLGAMSPSTDFDVKEYHLGGPKEWYLAGNIHFLRHNIYTSFPFLTEMHLLTAMVIAQDWSVGALAGQVVLMGFAPLTAWGVLLAGRRWFGVAAGRMAALLLIGTPWIFRISIIAYAEGGLAAYVFGAMFALLLVLEALEREESPGTIAALTGLTGWLAGCAMACKYTGLMMAVLPCGIVIAVVAYRTRQVSFGRWGWLAAIYILGVTMAMGPWLLKNLDETGNPVYPLGYRVFGGVDLDEELAQKWRRAHARPSAGSLVGELWDFGAKAFDVAAVNDWQSPLLFAFAPLALLLSGDQRRTRLLVGMTCWLFLVWWGMTHHLDRFWIPLIPSAALLAGVAAAGLPSGWPRRLGGLAIIVGTVFNLGFCATGFVGYNAGLTDLNSARQFAANITGPEIAWINRSLRDGTLPAKTSVLCVGEAELFDAEFPYVYNTVFDESLFEEWCGVHGEYRSIDRPLRPAAEIQRFFDEHRITHVFVNWREILRYRQSYGYTDFVTPSRFETLVADGVLDPPVRFPTGMGVSSAERLSSGELDALRNWAPSLMTGDTVTSTQLYPVRRRQTPP